MNTGILTVVKGIAPLLLYSTVLIVAFLSLTGRVKLGLLFLVPLLPLQNVVERLYQFTLGNNLNDILLICMTLGWLFSSIFKREKMFVPTSFNLLLIIMGIYTYFSLWQGSSFLGFPAPINPTDPRLQNWKNYMIFPLLYFITINNIMEVKHIKWIVLCMLLSMLLMNYYVINQIHWSSGLGARDRFEGTFVWLGPNETAAFYATYTFVLLGIFLYDRLKIRKLIFAFIIFLNIFCVLFLFSRGAYTAFMLGAIFICLFKSKKLLIPLLFFLFFWQTVLPQQVVERVNETKTKEGQLESSAEKRLIMWRQSIDLFKHNPITGAGFNTVWYLGFELGDTHNIFIKILAEQGIIGITIFLIIFYLSFRSSLKLYKIANNRFLKGLGLGFMACVVAMIVANMFGDRWTHTPLGSYYWVFLGLVERGRIISMKELAKK